MCDGIWRGWWAGMDDSFSNGRVRVGVAVEGLYFIYLIFKRFCFVFEGFDCGFEVVEEVKNVEEMGNGKTIWNRVGERFYVKTRLPRNSVRKEFKRRGWSGYVVCIMDVGGGWSVRRGCWRRR